MSKRLKQMIDEYFITAGKNAAAKLSLEAGVAMRTIYQVKNEGHVPRPDAVYRLAKACGQSEKVARDMSREAAGVSIPA